jgi:hypothetical protein
MKIGVDAAARDEARGVILRWNRALAALILCSPLIAALLFHLVGYLPDTAAQWLLKT